MMFQNDFVAIVPVRRGSKGLPGKNLRTLIDKPLYMHAVLQALRTVGRVVLSTDILEISEADLPSGCELLIRPSELAGDDASMSSVIAHAIESCKLYELNIVLLQATSPLRDDSDILATIALYNKGDFDLTLTVKQADSEILKSGTLDGAHFRAFSSPDHLFCNRQALPPVHRPNGAAYVFSARDFCKSYEFPKNKIGAVPMPQARSLDIDLEEDFNAAAACMASSREDGSS